LKGHHTSQIVDFGFSSSGLEKYLAEIGYWDTEDKKRRHRYVLSPCVYVLTRVQHEELKDIARAVYPAVQNLESALAGHARAPRPTSDGRRLLAMARSARHGLDGPGDTADEGIPPILKVDIVQKPDGGYQIVEIDTYNPRAIGTTTLLEASLIRFGVKPAYRITKHISALLTSRSEGSWTIVASERERYYETSYGIVARSLSVYGVRTHVISEADVVEDPTLIAPGNIKNTFIIPESLDRHPAIREALLASYRQDVIRVLYPPKAYLGSKGFLPFLSDQPGMKSYIPPTVILSKAVGSAQPEMHGAMVLKAVSSSGAKGVFFSDADRNEFDQAFSEALRAKTPQWILQEKVEQARLPVVVFQDGRRAESLYHVRITMHVGADSIFGIKVTGRTNPLVHGAPDCVQLPVVLG
jgi:hypothetical protein